MPVRVISSSQGDGAYFLNAAILQRGQDKGIIKFRDFRKDNGILYHKRHGRVYDFVRSARAEIRETVANYLTNILPGIDEDAKEDLRRAFETLFNHYDYKKNPVFEERLGLLISAENFLFPIKSYVAHVHFYCQTIKGPYDEYTVYARMICHMYTWFPFRETTEQDIVDVLREGLKCLSI